LRHDEEGGGERSIVRRVFRPKEKELRRKWEREKRLGCLEKNQEMHWGTVRDQDKCFTRRPGLRKHCTKRARGKGGGEVLLKRLSRGEG